MTTAKRLLWLLLLAPLGVGATTWYVCPNTAADGHTDVNYGAEDGTSRATCYDGFADIVWGGGGVVAGDTLTVTTGRYNEKFYVSGSGSAGSPITITFEDGAVVWETRDVSGSNSLAANTNQGLGTSSWQLVSGTTDIYKKGAGIPPFQMWVDDAWLNTMSTIPANEAAVVAGLGAGEFTSVNATTDGLAWTLYYRGAPTTDMLVNHRQSGRTATGSLGSMWMSDVSYVTVNNPVVRGFHPSHLHIPAALYIQGGSNVIINGPHVYENLVGIGVFGTTDVTIQGPDCVIEDNLAYGIGTAGHYVLAPSGVSQQIDSITQANPGVVTTNSSHGLSAGERVVLIDVSAGMTQTNRVEYVAGNTTLTANTFDIGVNTTGYTAMPANTDSGELAIQRTNTNTTISDCLIQRTANRPRNTAAALVWDQDSDGANIGYWGGTVTNFRLMNSRLLNNGPQRAKLGTETGDYNRGSGFLSGTTYTHSITSAYILGNWFEGNHGQNIKMQQAALSVIAGNVIAGMIDFTTTTGQVFYALVPASSTQTFANNVLTGASGGSGLKLPTTDATVTWIVKNNIFADLTYGAGQTWSAALEATSTTATPQESNNDFHNIQSGALFKRSSTTYTDIATWAAATGQGSSDVTTDPQFIGDEDYRLPSGSTLRRAGTCITGVLTCAYSDFRGRPSWVPPDIGAYQASSGDPAATRTAAAARTASGARTAAATRTARQ